jgi:cell division protein ZapA
MSKNDLKAVTIRILGKEYDVNSPPNEVDKLLSSATYLDEKMQEIRSKGNTVGLERIAVMAALNITYELMSARGKLKKQTSDTEEYLSRLETKIEKALLEVLQIED